MSHLLNSTQALKVLNIGNNRRYLKYLVDRNLLPRIVLGPRTFKYDPQDLEDLKERAIKDGLMLTTKPKKD